MSKKEFINQCRNMDVARLQLFFGYPNKSRSVQGNPGY